MLWDTRFTEKKVDGVSSVYIAYFLINTISAYIYVQYHIFLLPALVTSFHVPSHQQKSTGNKSQTCLRGKTASYHGIIYVHHSWFSSGSTSRIATCHATFEYTKRRWKVGLTPPGCCNVPSCDVKVGQAFFFGPKVQSRSWNCLFQDGPMGPYLFNGVK